ncbi:MAG: cobalamin-dependent protein [Nitrososphaeria archaeon]
MVAYDVVLIHPPSFYDFRREFWFTGPIANTVPICTAVFITFPIGFVSIGSYLQDRGIKVKIVNIAEKMVIDNKFDVEDFLKKLDSNIYAIDLHWVVHSQGAIKVAEICKKNHPDSIVVLGGLTSTYFADEIVSNFQFIDCVVRGEGEEPLFKLVGNISRFDRTTAFHQTPNLTFVDREKGVVRTDDIKVVETLDSLDFTRLKLVEPGTRALTPPMSKAKLWSLPICRGCTFNCATCGGSSYSYMKLMNRENPAFRSPKKILEDLMILDEQKISSVFLFQDPRLGGRKHVERLIEVLKGKKWSHIRSIGFELFEPADRSFLSYLIENRPADGVLLTISPESGVEGVRRAHGRDYSDDDLLRTCRYCRELNIPLGVFFMNGLGFETYDTIKQGWALWKKINSIEREVRGDHHVFVEFGPMIFLDPGSLAFDHPEKYRYRLRFKQFNDYYQAMIKSPYWAQWISYETLDIDAVGQAKIILDSLEKILDLKKESGMITEEECKQRKLDVELERIFVSEFDKIMKIEDLAERENKIRELDIISKDSTLSRSYVLTQSG